MDQYDLEEIKREIVESRALAIKTNNLVNALSADLKSIAKRQQSSERRVLTNTVGALVVGLLVVFVLVKLAWDARVASVQAETAHDRERLAQLEAEAKGDRETEESRARSARKAAEFYDLVAQNKRREVLDAYPEVAKLSLSKTERSVFEAAVSRAKSELSLIAYQNGLEFARNGRWHDAHQAFRESLTYENDAAHSARSALEQARALRELGRQREAIPDLMKLSEASTDREVMDDATLLLAECQLDIQAWNDAKATLRAFLRRFPNSEHSATVKLKLAGVSALH